MEKPQPVPGPEPEHQPPPYSGLFSSKYREYTPIAIPMPWPQDTATCSNPVNQGLPENGIPIPQPAPVNREGTRNQTVTDSSQPTAIQKKTRARRWCCRLGVMFGIMIISAGVRAYVRQEAQRNNVAKIQESVKRMNLQNEEMLDKLFHRPLNNAPRLQSQYSNRYQRMIHQDLNDYDIFDSNHRTVSDESIKLEESNRQRRDLWGDKRFDEKKIQRSIRKKGLYRVKKYVR